MSERSSGGEGPRAELPLLIAQFDRRKPLQVSAPLIERTPREPKAPERHREAQAFPGISVACFEPVQRESNVLVIECKSLERGPGLRPGEMGRCGLSEIEEI